MKKVLIYIVGLIVIGANGYADTIDRINDCQRKNGSNGCIYDILKELAANASPAPQPGQFCKCEPTSRNSDGGTCISPSFGYRISLKADNKTVLWRHCFANDSKSVLDACVAQAKMEAQCNFAE